MTEYDSPWKEAIDLLFEDFIAAIALFRPQIDTDLHGFLNPFISHCPEHVIRADP